MGTISQKGRTENQDSTRIRGVGEAVKDSQTFKGY